eukprot:gene8559-20144_t
MSGAEDDEMAPGKYKLLFDDVKKGLQDNILQPAWAESMARTLIILVRSCEQKLATSHVKHVDPDLQQLRQLDNQLINFTVDGEYWTLDCKTGSRTIEDAGHSWTQFDAVQSVLGEVRGITLVSSAVLKTALCASCNADARSAALVKRPSTSDLCNAAISANSPF